MQIANRMWFCDTSYTPQHKQKPALSSLSVSALTQPGSKRIWWQWRRWWRYEDCVCM